MRSSSVLSGVFHERVIICESDADRCSIAPYSTFRRARAAATGCTFRPCQRQASNGDAGSFVRELGVPVDVIADIDFIREETDLEKLVGALKGSWPTIQQTARQVRKSIEDRPGLPAGKVAAEIRRIGDAVDPESELPGASRRRLSGFSRRTAAGVTLRMLVSQRFQQDKRHNALQSFANSARRLAYGSFASATGGVLQIGWRHGPPGFRKSSGTRSSRDGECTRREHS